MRRVVLSVLLSLFAPMAALAAGVGFVPSGGIWFSSTDIKAGDAVRVYTVFVNTAYPELDATVVFYDNDDAIETLEVRALKKEEARQLRVFWSPVAGKHTVSVRVNKATAIDDKGQRTDLAAGSIPGIVGPTVVVGGIAPAQTTSVPPDGSVANSSAGAGASGGNSTVSALDDALAKNRAALSAVEGTANTIASTSGKAREAVETFKGIAEKTKNISETVQSYWAASAPIRTQVVFGWLTVSNNNEPKRLLIIGVIVLVLWLLYRRAQRRRFYRDF